MGAAFCAVALFGFFWMNIPGTGRLVPVYAVATAAILAIARLKGDAVIAALGRARRVMPGGTPASWLAAAVILGIALRVLAASLYPATPESDAVSYLALAHELAQGRSYVVVEGRAYWPPGLPLILAGLLPAFGSATTLVYNLATFTVTAVFTFLLGRLLAGWRVGCSAAMLLAIWPNFVFMAPVLMKECLLIALWPVAAYFYLKAQEAFTNRKAVLHALLAGAAVGYAALTQPSALLLPGCFAVLSLLIAGLSRRTIVAVIASVCGAAAVVAPWAVRDYVVLHHFEAISTSGGPNFFMVTQPESDGRWNAEAIQRATALGSTEIARDELGYSLGIKAIRSHPIHYLSTIVRKPFYMYGQDIKNVFWNFERGDRPGAATSYAYSTYYNISNAFYLTMILLIALFVMRRTYAGEAPPQFILLWMFILYPIAAQSLFEASERHRYGALSFMALFAGMALTWRADCEPAPYPARAA